MSPGAAHGDDQLALPLFGVQGQQVVDHIGEPGHKALGLLLLHDVPLHRQVQARHGAELLVVKGVGQAAHVEDQVRLHGDAELKAETDAVHRQGVACLGEEQLGDAGPQLGRGHPRGVDHIVRALLHGLEHLPLQLHRALQRAVEPVGQGVLSPGLFKPPHQHRVRGVQKQDLIGLSVPLQRLHGLEEGLEQLSPPGVGDHRHPAHNVLAFHAEVVKHGDQGGGQVVHAEKAHILHGVEDLGLPRSGKPGDNHKFHFPLLPLTLLP